MLVQRVKAQAARLGRARPELAAVIRSTAVLFQQRDVGRAPHLLDQRLLHRRAGGVGDMHDAPRRVAALARQVQVALLLGKGTPARQPVDASGACSTTKRSRRGRTGPRRRPACRPRGLQAVALVQDGGDAALGPAAGAVVDRTLGHHHHRCVGGQVQGGGQAGQAAADDENVEVMNVRVHAP